MAAIGSSTFVRDLAPFTGMWWDQAGKELKPEHPMIFEVKSAGTLTVTEPSAAYFGLASPMGDGEAVTYDTATQMYEKVYTMVKYGLGFVITKDMLDDGIALVKAERFTKELRKSMEHSRDQVALGVLNNAFGSELSADGVAICSASHPTLAGNVSNLSSAGSSLTEAALETALIDIGNFKDYRGLKTDISGQKLIVSISEEFNAHRLLNTLLRPGVADNDLNAIKSMGLLPGGVCVSKRLTDADAWFIKTDAPNGLVLQNRQDIKLSNDDDFDTDNARFKATMRFDVGCSNPLSLYGSQPA